MKGTKPGATHVVGEGGRHAVRFARWYRTRALEQWERLDLDALSRLARLVEKAQAAGRFIWVCGNGGSAAISSHVGCDLGKTAAVKGEKPLKAVSLADNVAFITATANDVSYDMVFARQLQNVVAKGDVVLLISGSGNSKNLLEAARLSRKKGATVFSLLGFDGGKLKSLSHDHLLVPSDQYGVVEDMHQSIAHILTFYLKQKR
jgi:D-sedoheptulose 7-phosphate isomerase